MFDADLTPLIAPGSALVAALIDAEGEPVATRAWSMRVVGEDPPMVRVGLQRGELEQAGHDLAHLHAPIAVTGAVVRTLESLQLKGWVVAVDSANADDLALLDQHLEGFCDAVEEKDRIPRKLLEYIFPDEFEMVTIQVHELFDQTPGPTAGDLLGRVES